MNLQILRTVFPPRNSPKLVTFSTLRTFSSFPNPRPSASFSVIKINKSSLNAALNSLNRSKYLINRYLVRSSSHSSKKSNNLPNDSQSDEVSMQPGIVQRYKTLQN